MFKCIFVIKIFVFQIKFHWNMTLWSNWQYVMPQSHPTMGPVRFLSPIPFLARKAEWSTRTNFTSVLVVTLGYGPRTIWHDCTLVVWSNNSQDSMGTPCRARAGIVRAPHENLQCFSYPTGPVRGPQGCHTAALWTSKGIDTTRIGKTPARASYLDVRAPYGPRRGCSRAVYNL